MVDFIESSIVQTGGNGSSTANAATVNAVVPPNVVAGQKMFALVVQQSVASTTGVIAPATAGAWTLRADASGHAGTTNPIDFATFTRTATAADAASTAEVPVVHQFTGTNVQGRMVVAIEGYGQVNDAAPILAAAFSTGSSSANRATASITTNAPSLLLVAVADRAASSYSPGTSGLLERADLADAIAPTAVSNTSLAVFDSGTSVPAGTYTRTVVAAGASPTSSTQAAVIIAIAEAAPAANVAPTVTLTPATITAAEPGETYTVTAAPADTDGTIASTVFASSTLTLTGTGLTRSFEIPLSLTEDVHTITVTTTDDKGATGTATSTVTQAACDGAVMDTNGQLVPFIDYVFSA